MGQLTLLSVFLLLGLSLPALALKEGECEEKQIDLDKVDLKKLKVRDLKKILNDWDENCDGCIEKTDYIKRIEELKPKYTFSTKKTEL
ncbi:hypothetical protein G9C98_000232 [Cotesia typhae]|uniref:EF-hand domain-containing protein n=1 Tax=Cotesia typhae TaxID=2053667 RepID=A0A8J5R1N7_9HYME|nr:hypothetical protein G9C98_000232 [Cotesia typhae]